MQNIKAAYRIGKRLRRSFHSMKLTNIYHRQHSHEDYLLVAYRDEDKYKIMKWRNEQMAILRQHERLTRKKQEEYYRDHILPSFQAKTPSQMLFSLILKEKCIGYGGLTNIDWQRGTAELSFLVKTARSKSKADYASDFSAFLIIITQIAFKELDMGILYTETYAFRKDHIAILEENGFVREKTLTNHVIIDDVYVDAHIHTLTKGIYESKK